MKFQIQDTNSIVRYKKVDIKALKQWAIHCFLNFKLLNSSYKVKWQDEIDEKIISIAEKHVFTNNTGQKKHILGGKAVFGELKDIYILSDRQMGSIMNKLGIKARQRLVSREKEKKDVNKKVKA